MHLPKFAPTTQRIQVGNGQYVAVLFVILVIIEIHGHLFEVFTLVSEIHGQCRFSTRNGKMLMSWKV